MQNLPSPAISIAHLDASRAHRRDSSRLGALSIAVRLSGRLFCCGLETNLALQLIGGVSLPSGTMATFFPDDVVRLASSSSTDEDSVVGRVCCLGDGDAREAHASAAAERDAIPESQARQFVFETSGGHALTRRSCSPPLLALARRAGLLAAQG